MGRSMDALFQAFLASLLVDREINYRLSRQAVRLGLSLPELQVLWILSKSDAILLTDLAMITTLSKDDLQLIVASLEADGLVIWIQDNASGKRELQSTEEGRALILKINICEDLGCSGQKLDPEIVWTYVQASRYLVATLRGHLPVGENHKVEGENF